MLILIAIIKGCRLIYFTARLFVIKRFFLIVQGQMNEKYNVIGGKKKGGGALLIITDHQRVSEVLLSFKSLQYSVLTQFSI